MSDTEEEIAPPDPTPKRTPTILGRLTRAVREQNWSAVVLEVLIVIVGVVLGFQVTAWGARAADEVRERTYLTQLAADLRETESRMDSRDARAASQSYYGIDRLIQAFGDAGRPPKDSVLAWLQRSLYTPSPRPVLGTAEGLVESGDLTILTDDSLRVAVSAYVDASKERLADQTWAFELANEHATTLRARIDLLEAFATTVRASPAGLMGPARAQSPIPALVPRRDWEAPFPLDTETFFRDEAAYTALVGLATAHMDLSGYRDGMRADALALRDHVETALKE